MSEAPASEQTDAEARLRLAWRIAPATASFILGIEADSRNTRDLVDGLLFAAIQAANVATITSSPELQLAYATIPNGPPDDLRRPVSVSAIANSLRMPFETARRRVQAMARIGALEVTAKGVRVSHAVLGQSGFLTNVFLRHELLKTFYLETKALGVLPPETSGPLPLRLTNRLIWEYMLRVADDLGATVGDASNGLILIAMIRQNVTGLAPDELLAWARDPLALGRPVRNRRLAEALNFSSETMRRYVIALEQRGLCVRGPLGLVAVAPPQVRTTLDRMVLDNLANVLRLFARLRQFGVLSTWDAAAIAA
jgi:DNA-binding Lrp family transcriptional regulator